MPFWDKIKQSNSTIDFYKEFVKNDILQSKQWDTLKENYFSTALPSKLLYKCISFDSNEKLNNSKLETIQNNSLWFAPHHVFINNDMSEFTINVDEKRVASETNIEIEKINHALLSIREMYDICCFSDRNHEYMWSNYANDHQGCCCVYSVKHCNDLWPVLYCNKQEVDFTDELINFFKFGNLEYCNFLAFVSPVLKDEVKYVEEHEVRLISLSAFHEKIPEFSSLDVNIKKANGYSGRSEECSKFGLELIKIIIGKNTKQEIKQRIYAMDLGVEIEEEK